MLSRAAFGSSKNTPVFYLSPLKSQVENTAGKKKNENISFAFFLISALFLHFRYKKQENQAAILKRFSMDADNSAFRALVNLHPFRPLFKRAPFCISKGIPFEGQNLRLFEGKTYAVFQTVEAANARSVTWG